MKMIDARGMVASCPEAAMWLAAVHEHLRIACHDGTMRYQSEYAIACSRRWLIGEHGEQTIAMLGIDVDLWRVWIGEIQTSGWKAPDYFTGKRPVT